MRISDWSSDVCSSDLLLLSVSIALLVHRLVLGARRVLGRVDPDVDDRRPAGLLDRLARAPQRRGDLAGIAHGLAVVAQHVPEYLEVDVAELVADVAALLAVLDDLAAADLVHRRVVADQDRKS